MCTDIWYVLWTASFGVWYVGIYLVILTWYQSQVEGRFCYWSRSKASENTHDNCSWDLLFLTIFGPRELLHCIRSVNSSEEPLLIRTKRFPFSLAMIILQFLRYIVFYLQSLFISLYFISILVLFIYITKSITFNLCIVFSVHLCVILENQMQK